MSMDFLLAYYTESFAFISELGLWGYGLIFFITAGDATILIGHFMTAVPFVFVAAVLAAQDYYSLLGMALASVSGALTGSVVSYTVGRYASNVVDRFPRIFSESRSAQAHELFAKYRERTILIGYFLGPIHAIVPFLAGISRMGFYRFLLWNLLGSVIWTISVLALGYIVYAVIILPAASI